MDIGLREWLFVIGLIVIGAILFDGWRRMRGGKAGMPLREMVNRAARQATSAPLRAETFSPSSAPAAAEESRLAAAPTPAVEVPEDRRVPPQLVLAVHVRSNDPEGFDGRALIHNILESGLRFGDMDIFHRHETMNGTGEVLFSMANGVNPGIFDLTQLDQLQTPAISFFMTLPGPQNPHQSFDLMINAAHKVAHELGGELQNEQRTELTAQCYEQYRRRIHEFEQSRHAAAH